MSINQLFLLVLLPIVVLSLLGILSYFIIKYWREQKAQANSLTWQSIQLEKSKATMSMRFQAYERMILLCERIAVPNLIMRLRTEGATANDFRLAMLIAIQQEFEHNVTQQIYVSDNLWNILKITRDNTAEIINIAFEKLEPKADSNTLITEIFKILNEQQGDSSAKAQAAIRQEAALLIS
jgi:capsular polysaccharide biosynthesis protein